MAVARRCAVPPVPCQARRSSAGTAAGRGQRSRARTGRRDACRHIAPRRAAAHRARRPCVLGRPLHREAHHPAVHGHRIAAQRRIGRSHRHLPSGAESRAMTVALQETGAVVEPRQPAAAVRTGLGERHEPRGAHVDHDGVGGLQDDKLPGRADVGLRHVHRHGGAADGDPRLPPGAGAAPCSGAPRCRRGLRGRGLAAARRGPAPRATTAESHCKRCAGRGSIRIPLVTTDRLILEYASSHGGTPVVDARP